MHIHGGSTAAGAAGTTGAIRVNLCADPTLQATDHRNSTPSWIACSGTADNTSGTITWASGSTKLEGDQTVTNGIPAPDNLTFDQFVTAMRASNLYVNVHTTGNPKGEVRGQLVVPALP